MPDQHINPKGRWPGRPGRVTDADLMPVASQVVVALEKIAQGDVSREDAVSLARSALDWVYCSAEAGARAGSSVSKQFPPSLCWAPSDMREALRGDQ